MDIRDATLADLSSIDAIYNHYVVRSTCTAQYAPAPFEVRRAWFAEHGGAHPVIVAVEGGGEVVGWGSLSRFHAREGYRFTVEDSVYVRHDRHRRGIGRALLEALLRRAVAAGHRTVIASIAGDQEGSIALHRLAGFAVAGQLRDTVYKLDRWLDVVLMQRAL